MEKPDSPLRRLFASSIIVTAYFAAVMIASLYLSPAVDEPHHIRSGMAQISHGIYVDDAAWWAKPDPLHPPIDMLPAFAVKVLRGSADFRNSPRIDPIHFIAARWPSHIFGALLLLIVFLFARDLWGKSAGIFAMAMLALNPLFLAHASIVSSDLTAAFGGTLAAFAIWRGFLRGDRWLELRSRHFLLAVLSCGAAIAFAIVCKVSNLLFVAIACIAIIAGGFRARRSCSRWLASSFAASAITSMLAIFLAACVYGFTGVYRDPFMDLGRSVQLGFFNDLFYCADYALDLGKKLPSPVYYKGWFQNPSPKHYLAAFLYKTPLPLLILLGAGGLAALIKAMRRRNPGAIALLAMVGFMAIYFTTRGFYLGFRHLLLPVSLLTVLAGSIFAAREVRVLTPEQHNEMRARMRSGHAMIGIRSEALVILLLIVPLLWINFRQFPWWTANMNSLARKPLTLVDSDYDWGQGLIALADWQTENAPHERIWLAYFGSADPTDYGVRYRGLISPFAPGMKLDPEWEKGADPEQLDGWVAISATQLAGTFMGEAGQPPDYYAKWLEVPLGSKIAGGTIWIYDCRRNH